MSISIDYLNKFLIFLQLQILDNLIIINLKYIHQKPIAELNTLAKTAKHSSFSIK
jgi:hypothetical protein